MGNETEINFDYVLAQFDKALTPKKVEQWRGVIDGIIKGDLEIGSRTPVRNTPAWVTLEVAHGGFATGNFLAGGPLLDHENEKLQHLKRAKEGNRATLNAHYLGIGLGELREMLDSGRYRVDVPEEAALLAVAWLLNRGEVDRAAEVTGRIRPYLPTLRFYPRPSEVALSFDNLGVSIESVSETIGRLREKAPQRQVEAQREALTVWQPLYERAVSLVIETFEGELPRLVERNGKRVAEGGWPLSRIASDWVDRVKALLKDHAAAAAQHKLCTKPHNPKENYCQLRNVLQSVVTSDSTVLERMMVGDPKAIAESRRKVLRNLVAAYVTAHGLPGSDAHEEAKQVQLRHATRPGHFQLAGLVADRLKRFNNDDEGCEVVQDLLGPVSAAEAAEQHLLSGAQILDHVKRTAMRCMQAQPAQLVELGLIPSADVLAEILPKWTARSAVAAIENPALRTLYVATYQAFRNRRSLLLTNLQRQVQFSELPWVHELMPWVRTDSSAQRTAFNVLRDVTLLALRSFPYRIIPNPLVKELKALVTTSGLTLPLNEELAADIFQGAFSRSFNDAALLAATRLSDTLYSRYYGIDYEDFVFAREHHQPLHRVAHAMVKRPSSNSVARNGQTIEQAQIITTHNLAPLVIRLELEPVIAAEALDLAKQCFAWITHEESSVESNWRALLHRQKNCAYAFRQMVFFLTLAKPETVADFFAWARTVPGANHDRLAALELAQGGTVIDEGDRFLGWSAN